MLSSSNSTLDLSFIKKIFFGNKSAKRINHGDCFNWAVIAKDILKDRNVLLFSDKQFIHAFVKIDGMFYDAEVPTGIHQWKMLPSYSRYPVNKIVLQSKEEFVEIWKRIGLNSSMLHHIPEIIKNKKEEVSKYVNT